MGFEWLTPTGFLLALAALYLSLRPRLWVEALFVSVASAFTTLWGLHDALAYGAPGFYTYVAAPTLVLDGLAMLLAVLTGTVVRKLARARGLP